MRPYVYIHTYTGLHENIYSRMKVTYQYTQQIKYITVFSTVLLRRYANLSYEYSTE